MLRLEVTRGQTAERRSSRPRTSFVSGERKETISSFPIRTSPSEHAKIVFSSDKYILVDQRSTNGTAILRNGERIALDDTNNREVTVEDGDVIELGSQESASSTSPSRFARRRKTRASSRMRKIEELVPQATLVEKDEPALARALRRAEADRRGPGSFGGPRRDLRIELHARPLATHATIILRDDDEEAAAKSGGEAPAPPDTCQ